MLAGDGPIAVQAQVLFSPGGGCTAAIVGELDAAKSRILVQAYSFTSLPIAKALRAARQRGIDIQVILDKSQRSEKYSSADFIANSGIPVLIDESHAIAHNKVIIIDDQTVISGSFNFTKSAEESNAENLLVLRSPELAKRYTANWKEHAGHGVPFQSRLQAGERP
jgi:phosphatidylserine/phosphatidylglycerophosphate/cardiolipin synthase-like enzyme